MTRVAAIDCGTNSLRLLVADVVPGAGELRELDRRTTIVRLGQGVDRTGVFAPAALTRTFDALAGYQRVIEALDVERTRLVATSAARDVGNRDDFEAGVLAAVGVRPDVVDGDEEARLSYQGAVREITPDSLPAPVAVLDIGGGSSELVTRDPAGDIVGHSLDIGSVRLTERHLHHDPPDPAEVAAGRRDIATVLGDRRVPASSVGSLVGVAGTITTVAAMVLDLPGYDRSRVHRAVLGARDVRVAVDRLVAMSVAERRSLPYMLPQRADVIGAGGLILTAFLDRLGSDELVVSEYDILDGIALSLVEGGSPGPPR